MRPLIIINDEQFGYHIDTYKYAQKLKDKYSIIYICQDHKKNKVIEKGIIVFYINGSTTLFPFKVVIKLYNLKLFNSLIFIKWHPFSFIYRLYIRKSKMILDIRTFSVAKSKNRRIKKNLVLFFDSLFFKNISFINENLRNRLSLFRKMKNNFILPLGADINSNSADLTKKEINLVYIGTYNNRNLVVTIKGLSLFYEKYNDKYKISYMIYGNGNEPEEKLLKNAIKKLKCEKYIFLMGFLEHSKINEVLINNNIGISFVPITKYYNFQPPTKTFEYLANGLIVLATKTNANSDIINSENGVLINDNPDSFFNGLLIIAERINQYKTSKIKDSISGYSWDNISNKLVLIFKTI